MEKQAKLLTEYADGKAPMINKRNAHTRSNKDNSASALWLEIQTLIEEADRLQQTATIMRQHLPALYHEYVRVLWTEKAWIVSVERPALANELNWVKETLCAEIYKTYQISPIIKINCKPHGWAYSGLLLKHPRVEGMPLPSVEEADHIINSLLHDLS